MLDIDSAKSLRQAAFTDERLSISILDKIDKDFESGRFSYVGDKKDFKLVFVSMASILHAHSRSVAKPVGTFIVGPSSTGKTELMYAAARLFPDEWQINLTTISSKSLIYHCMEDEAYLNAKILLVEEMSGIKDLDMQYLLRILVTKGKAVHNTVLGGRAYEIPVRGEISLQSTGLPGDKLRDDTMNRLIKISSDSSKKMNTVVVDHIKSLYTDGFIQKDDNFSDYHNFLKNLNSYEVVIPYADKIVFDTSEPDSRRKAKIFFDLLSSLVLINQHLDRKIDDFGRLYANEEDFYMLCSLFKTSGHDLSHLNPKEKIFYELIQSIFANEIFTYADITKATGGYSMTVIKEAVIGLKNKNILDSWKVGKIVHYKMKSVSTFGVIGLDTNK